MVTKYGRTTRPAGGKIRTIRYREIAEELRRRITSGEFSAGRVLPSEADLSGVYSASRVTVRKALESLRVEGLVDSRQGFGWFVAAHPVRQPLLRLATIEEQLSDAGIRSERRIVDFGFVPAVGRVQEVLGEQTVLEVRRLNLADGQPFALVTVWCPESLGAHLSRVDVERASFLSQLPVQPGGATQVIGAAAASDEDAKLLDIPVGSPVLCAERVTKDVSGRAVLLSEHKFPAHLTEFVVELPSAESAFSPAGLRLVE